jgi:hypothetical protein
VLKRELLRLMFEQIIVHLSMVIDLLVAMQAYK